MGETTRSTSHAASSCGPESDRWRVGRRDHRRTGAIALARGLCPREFGPDECTNVYQDRYDTHQRFQCVLPTLYKTWVTLPAMISADGTGGLLATDDLKSDAKKPVLRSLLNASLLDAIKRTAIEAPGQGDVEVKPPVPFIAQRLHIYLTISNMRGIPFKVEFGRNSYGMQTIGDRIHYVVTDLGTKDLSQPVMGRRRCERSWHSHVRHITSAAWGRLR
jgi:hypothetical protein